MNLDSKVIQNKMSEKPLVLLVDDDEDILYFLKRAIQKRFDVEIVTFESSLEALRFLESGASVSCIVLDYQMPDMNGFEFAEKIAKIPLDMPVIFLTGYGSSELEKQAFKLSCYDFALKPVSAEFYQSLENVLRLSRLGWEKQG